MGLKQLIYFWIIERENRPVMKFPALSNCIWIWNPFLSNWKLEFKQSVNTHPDYSGQFPLPDTIIYLKEYYEIVNEARPLSGFFPTDTDTDETKQASKFQNDPSSKCFTIDFWKINCWIQHFISYFLTVFLYLILHKFCSVLTCDILGIGLFISVQMWRWKNHMIFL